MQRHRRCPIYSIVEKERPQSSYIKATSTCMMDFYVDYSCEDNNETGRTKLTVSDFDTTSIRDVKYAIQAAIQAPVCDQQLFYQGQPVTDDGMTLVRLYFRECDCFKVKFLAAANIARMSELMDELKNFAREVVEKHNRQLPVINTKDEHDSLKGVHDFFFVRQKNVCLTIEELDEHFLHQWKCLKTVAQRHFFVQEGGFEALLEVFKFSRQMYHVYGFSVDENSVDTTMIPDRNRHLFNQWQLVLQMCCQQLLWGFGETPQDQKFLLSKDVFPLVVDSLLLQPPLLEETGHNDVRRRILAINETALGPFGALVEYDPNIQKEVSKMSRLIGKLLFIIDRCQSEPAGYSLFSSQMASTIFFYCTFNVKSAQPLMDCGALEKMLNITLKLQIDKESDVPLRYYCCLFLARLRSAPLVKLDRDTCASIDELIDVFLEQHVFNEISEWEEMVCSTWTTMVPLVHLAFAAGKEYYCNQTKVLECDTTQSEDAHFLESKQSNVAITEYNEAEAETSRSDDKREEKLIHQTSWKLKAIKIPTLSDTYESVEAETSVSGDKNRVTPGRKDQFIWPGSPSTQKLGMFSLMHMLSRNENQQLALAENLLSYLMCLSWHLKVDEKEKLRTSLENFHNDFSPPSLKIIAKSVLALVNGLDMVYKL